MGFPLRVNDVMSHPARTERPNTSAADAAKRCHEQDIGSLVVVEDDAIVGIVTSDDFVRLLAEDPAASERLLTEVMTTEVQTIDATETVIDAASRMVAHEVSRLVVLDGDALVGLVSTDDIVHHSPQILQRRTIDAPGLTDVTVRVRQETAFERQDWDFECLGCSEDGISVGDRATFEKTISDEDVRAFATASGDTNRLHLDETYARETRFGGRIVHGTLVGGLISAALARLPGVTIYLSQDLTFLKPVDIGQRATAVCEVVEDLGRDKYQLTTDVKDATGETLLEGQCVVLIDDPPGVGHVDVEPISTD